MKPWFASVLFATLACGPPSLIAASLAIPAQYVVLNRKVSDQPAFDFAEIKKTFPVQSRVKIGVGYIFSYLRTKDDEALVRSLRDTLKASEQTAMPVLIQLDGENWWDARPDLWNWWDPTIPGFNPENRINVEWTGWTPDQALKLAWRNWGKQLRVRPPPNLMSPRYREVCHEKMELLIPVILGWWKQLPPDKSHLLVGIKVGWESSIGVNAWYYPNGNDLINKPASEDPTTGLNADLLPGRGVTPIGYAAVKTARIRTQGELTEADLAEVVRRHLDDLCHVASKLGVPREKLFTHVAGWKEEELLYKTGLNRFSCPGWSFYKYAADPAKDKGVQAVLAQSDAPCWSATEWLYQGPRETKPWREALEKTLSDARCRYLCIYNWENIRGSEAVLEAIRQVVAGQKQY